MPRCRAVSLLTTAFVMWVAPLQGQAYAPPAPIPEAAENDPSMALAVMFLQQLDIPARADVPIPPYPGAVVIQTMASQTATGNDEEFDMLPVIVLVTTDPVDQVAAHYAAALEGWNTKTVFGQHYFWQGEMDYDPFDIESSTAIQSLVIMEDLDREALVPGAQAELQVRYRP